MRWLDRLGYHATRIAEHLDEQEIDGAREGNVYEIAE